MTLHFELLATAREADVKRQARADRLRDVALACRRLVLGVLPIGQACEPCTTC
ncbi:MAG: hypothetical protein ACRDGD_00250 [Candidatus Limnocylindria bacterium]